MGDARDREGRFFYAQDDPTPDSALPGCEGDARVLRSLTRCCPAAHHSGSTYITAAIRGNADRHPNLPIVGPADDLRINVSHVHRWLFRWYGCRRQRSGRGG